MGESFYFKKKTDRFTENKTVGGMEYHFNRFTKKLKMIMESESEDDLEESDSICTSFFDTSKSHTLSSTVSQGRPRRLRIPGQPLVE